MLICEHTSQLQPDMYTHRWIQGRARGAEPPKVVPAIASDGC